MKFNIPVELDRNEIKKILEGYREESARFSILGLITIEEDNPCCEYDECPNTITTVSPTQLGNILKTQVEKHWCLVDGRLRNRTGE